MGLPRYILNYDEAIPYIKEAISQAELKINADGLDFSNVTNAIIDTSKIENKITNLININDILNNLLEQHSNDISTATATILSIKENNKPILKNLIDELNNELDATVTIRQDLEDISNHIRPLGDQKIKGFYKYIPPGRKDNTITFKVNKDIYLTAITVSQIGWKLEDTYSLIIDGSSILNNISTKEVGEKKRFSRRKKVPANTDINFILHNNSGNSRQLWVDFEYIESTS